MTRKLIIDVDPGIGDAVAIILALLDPELDVLALTATGGCIPCDKATRNLRKIVEDLDPPKWPRIGDATLGPGSAEHEDPIPVPGNLVEAFSRMHGVYGLGESMTLVSQPVHCRDSSKVLTDFVRDNPHQVTLLTLGPLHNVAAACEREPEFLNLLEHLVCLGGTHRESGDATAVSELNLYLNPEAASMVLCSPAGKKTLVPLDVSHKLLLTLEQFGQFGSSQVRGAELLRSILPTYFRAHHQILGIEGILLSEVVALAVVARPHLFQAQPACLKIETRGELTRGMTVFDRRTFCPRQEYNIKIVTDIDLPGVINYMEMLLLPEH